MADTKMRIVDPNVPPQAMRTIDFMTQAALAAQNALMNGDAVERVQAYLADVQRWAGFALIDIVADNATKEIASRFASGMTRAVESK